MKAFLICESDHMSAEIGFYPMLSNLCDRLC